MDCGAGNATIESTFYTTEAELVEDDNYGARRAYDASQMGV